MNKGPLKILTKLHSALADLRGGAPGTRPRVQIISFSCSFRQKLGYHTHFGSWRHPQENPGSAIAVDYWSVSNAFNGGIFKYNFARTSRKARQYPIHKVVCEQLLYD